ncbi:MAG: WG repeat-containing protein [Prevotellaceae bacterium]|nr:WG repeat-containing protein [Prevotellaceae bacterium]
MDKTGKEVIPLKYDYVSSFEEGLAKVELNGKWGSIDQTGKKVILLNNE